jgi:hypothetical protein
VEVVFLLLAVVVLVLFDLVSVWYGADSRDGNDWAKHKSL